SPRQFHAITWWTGRCRPSASPSISAQIVGKRACTVAIIRARPSALAGSFTRCQIRAESRCRCTAERPATPGARPSDRGSPPAAIQPRSFASFDMLQEILQAFAGRVLDHVARIAVDRDLSVLHEDQPCAHLL